MMATCLCGCGKDVPEHEGRGRPGQYATTNCRKRAQRQRGKQDVTKIGLDGVLDVTKIGDSMLCGDALTMLKRLPDRCVQMCVTSPPYYGLRDYGVSGQIGLETTPQDYIEKLVKVFREVRRVLKDDGILWVNIGDSYASDGKWGGSTSGKHVSALHGMNAMRARKHTGLKAKDLIGIPWMLAFALRDDGWYLRSDIIWGKGNSMPESVKDRVTKSHEYLFMLSKSEHYYFNSDAIREPLLTQSNLRRKAEETWGQSAQRTAMGEGLREWNNPLGRNKRSVWQVNTQPFPEAHFAVMPPKLVEPCILAGSHPGDIVLDPFCGAGTVPLVALQHGRHYLGIELNPTYIELAKKRIATTQPVLWNSAESEVS